MVSLGFSLHHGFFPLAAPPKIRLFKASSLSGKAFLGTSRNRNRKYACQATPEKPPAQIDSNQIEKISGMLRSMADGEISVSAYDTAWVALVPSVDGAGGPQFPESLKWIEESQLSDGSWGDSQHFPSYDRLMNTLACVIALRTWGVSPDKCRKGIAFLAANMERVEEEDADLMPLGFEVAFLSLAEMARSMELDIPFDCAGLEEINKRKNIKLKKIPRDVLHQVPTTLLYSLAGMTGLDWEKILRLQCADGSILSSPSSTAFAHMQTRDNKCLDYLQRIVRRFNGGAPTVYPVDLFERLWAVDRLERLGISRYFSEEIRQCLDYAYNCWTQDGISWARAANVEDGDCTAMGFRLLRLHGYDVTPDAFRRFERDGEFFFLPGQSTQAVTGMYNLNRAAQLSYPAESILQDARRFSRRYLEVRRALNKLTDKWVISKDLPSEVSYALDFPWYASLPRVETRLYLEQYGGESDVWIGKTLYRTFCVNNEDYLELAKLDFRPYQSVHRLEWFTLQRWFVDSKIYRFGLLKEKLLSAYFVAAASIFEPERSAERLGWTHTAVLVEVISSYFTSHKDNSSTNAFMDEVDLTFRAYTDGSTLYSYSFRMDNGILGYLSHLLDLLSSEARPSPPTTHGEIRDHLCRAWNQWLQNLRKGEDDRGLLLVRTLELCAGRTALEDSLAASAHPQNCHLRLAQLVSSSSRRLRHHTPLPDEELDHDMRELVMLVLSNGAFEGDHILQAFLTIAKSFNYVALCSSTAFESHIDKVLFQDIL